MKNNRNNRDKLNDAVGILDEELVQSAMLHVERIRAARVARRAVIRRRVAILAAACLTVCMAAGAILAVPLLTADDPGTVPGPDTDTVSQSNGAVGNWEDTSAGETLEEEPYYVEVPMVQVVQLSASENTIISDESMPVEQVEVDVNVSQGFFIEFPVLLFDCRPGETVTVQADVDCLGYVDMPWDANADWRTRQEFCDKFWKYRYLQNPEWAQDGVLYFTNTLTVDPTVGTIGVQMPRTDEDIAEVVLTFTITNDEGKVTGAGSFYVSRKHLLTKEELELTRVVNPFLYRSVVLGSVRFNENVDVSEDGLAELWESFAARVNEVKATIDYSPVTSSEFIGYAKADIIRTEFKGQLINGSGNHWSSWQDFRTFELTPEDTGETRLFIIFGDGEWFECRSHGECTWVNCHLGCPNQKEEGVHHAIGEGCYLRTYDGRVYEVQRVSPDSERETLVLIEDPTE